MWPSGLTERQGCFKPICGVGCKDGGHYSPDTDTLRYCLSCAKWFHVDCIIPVDDEELTLPAPSPDKPKQLTDEEEINDALSMGEIEYTVNDYMLWRKLMRLPIQRGYKGHDYPLSYELLISALREIDREEGCPGDVRDVVRGNLAMGSHLKELAEKYLDIFHNLVLMPTVYYRCDECPAII